MQAVTESETAASQSDLNLLSLEEGGILSAPGKLVIASQPVSGQLLSRVFLMWRQMIKFDFGRSHLFVIVPLSALKIYLP